MEIKAMMSEFAFIIIFFTTFFSYLPLISSQDYKSSTKNLGTSWINIVPTNVSTYSTDNSSVMPILVTSIDDQASAQFACGFYCNGKCDSYYFAIFIVHEYGIVGFKYDVRLPHVVWSANRNNPVGIDASLQLTAEGGLVLRDADGTLAWPTDTAGKAVAGLHLTDIGNLVLFDANNSVVWQSFDHPTNCLLPGQILEFGKNLTASASSTNWTRGGLYSVLMTEQGLVAYILSDPQLVYGSLASTSVGSYAKFRNGSLDVYRKAFGSVGLDISIPIPQATYVQYMELGVDGHLRVFEVIYPSPNELTDIFKGFIGECDYPLVCGKYGICSNGQCRCPSGPSFRLINVTRPDLGCSEVIPLTCNALENHTLQDLDGVTYFGFKADINGIDINRCKESCLRNCSCKAAIFRYGSNHSTGDCFLPSQIFSLISKEDGQNDNNISVSIKVQNVPEVRNAPTVMPHKGEASLLRPILGSTLGVLCVSVVIGTAVFVHQRRRRRRRRREFEEVEDYLDQVSGMPTRFSFEELESATDDFKNKLGEGGFGSVFEGTLNDGTRIAVKRLDGIGHIKKSFLAEVQTIGSIHHINLVRLIGFCAEKFHSLLVYEYMCNGSLERWIYCKSHETMLEWSCRRKIILDIAKGLAYLHDDCRQKIIHLDIKPQNILLDEHYNAKLADFGLSKLVDRNQSNVITTMRGTPGYLAPEWLNAVITEKVDVYSFGVVILEILCGKKIFDHSRSEEERHLPTLFMKKAEQGEWLNLVDKCCLDVESNVGEVEEMMQISAWCLQSNYEKRPCMSMVIKVLEGALDVQEDIDYNFLIPQYLITRIQEVSTSHDVTPLLPSILSGPR